MEAPFSKEDRFKKWLKDNGACFNKLDFHADSEGCGGAYSLEDIAEDEVFASIPFDPLVITAAKARKALPQAVFHKQSLISFDTLNTNFGNSDTTGSKDESLPEVNSDNSSQNPSLSEDRGGLGGLTDSSAGKKATPFEKPHSELEEVVIPDRIVVILYLIQQKLLGEESFYYPFFSMVPESIPTALTMDSQDLEFLRGTNAFLAVQNLKEKLKKQYDTTMQMVGHALPPKDYTWERFLWAETIISSRAFPAHLFGEAKEDEVAIVPLSDMLNHNCRQKATWTKTEKGINMSGSFVKAGDQVFNNYGPKNNPDDHVALKANFSRDPDRDRKRAILERAGLSVESVHYLRHEGIPASLLMAMRVMAMNPYEAEYYYGYFPMKGRSMKDMLEFVGFRNEFAMLDLLDLLFGSKVQALHDSDRFLSEPKNDIQRFALIYRNGQKCILDESTQQLRGMFAALLLDAQNKSTFQGNAPFLALENARPTRTESQLQDLVRQETRTMTELKEEAIRTLVMEARGLMIRHNDDIFGEALMTAFPNHGWGDSEYGAAPANHSLHTTSEEMMEAEDEMAIQLEQDAILMSYLIYLRYHPDDETKWPALNFVRAACQFDYASILDEDMSEDILDLHASLSDVFEAVDDKVFDPEKFSPAMFLWASGVLEVHSISFHLTDGQAVSGIMPR
ncbi:hypothetical protein BGZ73_002394 [Actinomortierella ambigua]|nr:hypothetical protein BGZ73_002394 [Actinomortierella ambigua]